MGNSKSSEIVVTDNMSGDKSESFNVVNIHSPIAGLGLSLAFGIPCMYLHQSTYPDLRQLGGMGDVLILVRLYEIE